MTHMANGLVTLGLGWPTSNACCYTTLPLMHCDRLERVYEGSVPVALGIKQWEGTRITFWGNPCITLPYHGALIPHLTCSVCLLVWGGSAHRVPPSTMDENKSTKTSSAWGGKVADLSREKGQAPCPHWAFIGFICTGIQIKLINHCQAVRIKQ